MLVVPQKKALVLALRDPGRVTAVIPNAKQISVKGRDYVVVKHGLDESKVLKNLGLDTPSPIRFYYKWSGTYTPFDAQRVTAEFLTMNSRAYVLNDIGCVDAETEYLSPTGWKKISEYAGGKVAQYWPDRRAAEFVEPTEFVKKPCDTMVRVKTKYGLDQLLSPEHRILLHGRTNPLKREVVQAADLFLRQGAWLRGERVKKSRDHIGFSEAAIPVTFMASGGAGLALSDQELRLQVAVIADGHFPNDTSRCVVRLKKQRKKDRLRATLRAASIAWKETDSSTVNGFTTFAFQAPLRKKVFDAYFWDATPQQLAAIADEVMHWDGNIGIGRRGDRFSTYERQSADFIQYAFSGTGRIARILENKRERRGRQEVEYVVQTQDSDRCLQLKGVGVDGKRMGAMSVEPSPDGFKYCFMVPSTFLVLRRNGCVFCTGNTGKSLSTLWAYDYLRSVGRAKKMLVVSPLSTMEMTWGNEIFRHFTHLDYTVVHGDRKKRLKLLDQDADVYIINHDGVEIIAPALKNRDDIDIITVDELTQVARNAGTDRWKALNVVINKQVPRSAWGLTGLPTPNSPLEAWAQCRLITPTSVPPYSSRFRDSVMRQVGPYNWVPRDNALDVVREAMKPAVRFSRDECIDLPPAMYETRSVPLTGDQSKAYKEMLNTMRTEAAAGEILAVNEAVKAGKLVQIACGVAYGSSGEEVSIPATPRLNVVNEIVDASSNKVIVFVPFVSAVEQVAASIRSHLSPAAQAVYRLSNRRDGGGPVECIHGGVSKAERDRIFRAFQHGDEVKVLVAQPAAMSHGLTLTAANTIVWYAPVASNDTFVQANGRITRPGQKNNQYIVMIEGTAIERRMYERLRNRQQMQGLLLDMIKAESA